VSGILPDSTQIYFIKEKVVRKYFAASAPMLALAFAVLTKDGNAQSADVGEQAFRSSCASCHSVAADGKSGPIAPNLRGIVGRKAASNAFKSYSPALTNYKVVWNAKTLDAYLANPARVVPGTRMIAVAGDAKRRQAIIQYLARTK
jgi:cytochrome c